MKTKHYLIIGTLGIALTGVLFTSCKKSSTAPPTDTTAAQDESNASFAIQDSKNISDGAAKGQAVDRTMGMPCAHIRKIPDTVYNAVHDSCWDINFGTTDCLCLDGRTRRGEILVFWNGKNYFDTGSVITMTFRNYYFNDIGVTGTRMLTNTGKNTWKFHADLSLIYPSSGGTATWSSDRTNVLTTVGTTNYWAVSGSASGTSRKGSTYSISITSPLYVTFLPWWLGGCAWIESGNLTVNISGWAYPIYVVFGTGVGNCNNKGTATIDGNNFSFTQN